MMEIEVKGNKSCRLRPSKPEVAGSIPVPPPIASPRATQVTSVEFWIRSSRSLSEYLWTPWVIMLYCVSWKHKRLFGYTILISCYCYLTTEYRYLIENGIPRYHHLKFGDDDPVVDSVIDFKHYFTLNVEELMRIKDERFVCKVSQLYRESISQRLAYFLSRIGLPNMQY